MMRVAGRILLAVLAVGLICAIADAFPGSRVSVSAGGAGVHKPHHAPPAIESAPVSAATSSVDEWVVAPVIGAALRASFGARIAFPRTSRATALAAEIALDQRPPPPHLLA
jgi:hypothetical protein